MASIHSQQQAAMGGILSSMQGAANKQAFSINSFTGSGMNEASVFHALQDTKDAMGGGFGAANLSGLGEMLMKARESQSPLAKMLAAFNKDDGFHAFEMWANANKDAIAGKDSPNWGQHADQQRQADHGAGHDKHFDPNNPAYHGIHDSEARNAAQQQGQHHGQDYGHGGGHDGHGGGDHSQYGQQGQGGYGDGSGHNYDNQGHHGHGDGDGPGGAQYGNSDHTGPGGAGGDGSEGYQHERGGGSSGHGDDGQEHEAPGRGGDHDNGGRPYGEHEQVGPGGGDEDWMQREHLRTQQSAQDYGSSSGYDSSPAPTPRPQPFSGNGGDGGEDGGDTGSEDTGSNKPKALSYTQAAAQGFTALYNGAVSMTRLGSLSPNAPNAGERSIDAPAIGGRR